MESGGEKRRPAGCREETESSSTSWTDVEARAVRGRLLLETPSGAYAVEPTPGGLLSIAYKLVETRRETLQAMHRRVVEEVARTEGAGAAIIRAASDEIEQFETRSLEEGPAAGGAARSGGSTTSAEPACTLAV